MNSPRPAQESWLTRYLLPLGSVLIAALALLTQSAQLPKWAIVVAVLYLVVVAGVSLYGPGARLLFFIEDKGRSRRLRKTYFPKLSEGVGGLRRLLAQDHSNTVLYLLQDAGQWDEFRGRYSPFQAEHVETLRAWFASIEGRIKRYRWSSFSDLCAEVSHLVFWYNRVCCQGQRALEEVVAAGQLPEQRLRSLMHRWNVQRDEHAAFVREWTSFCRSVNESAKRELCVNYYEPLGTLE